MKAPVNIDANVIRQLGDELVTDAEQALLELIKNSYDADADRVRLFIDPEATEGLSPGTIRVEDNGSGMTEDQLLNGWLRISLSLKREAKALGKKTKRGRTPLGDKGLGRLSTMKLGDTVEINTYPSKTQGYTVKLDWSKFTPGTNLSAIRVDIDEIEPIGRTGTMLTITNLRDVEHWRQSGAADALRASLSKLISPFRTVPEFRVSGDLNGNTLKTDSVAPKLRETATTHFSFKWGPRGLSCKGRVKLSLFKSDKHIFEHHVLPDGGAELLGFLAASKYGKGLNAREAKAPWFVDVEGSWTFEEIEARAGTRQISIENPGPFEGEVDGFDLESVEGKQAELFSSLGEYRKFVKRMSGVSIYRDGFAIRADNDWLGLGESWTSGRSYYGLRPANTVGFVAISAADNDSLIEKSDREGFLDNPASRGFSIIVETFVGFANDALTNLRREFNKFRSQKKASDAKLPKNFEQADAIDTLKRLGTAAASRSVAIKKSEDQRRESFLQLKAELQTAAKLPGLDKVTRTQLAAVESRFVKAVATWDKAAADAIATADEFQQQSLVADAVIDRLDQMKNQNDELVDFVAIGLVAQALAHDVRMLLDDLLARTRKIAPKAKAPKAEDIAVYIESVRGTVHALRKQLTFLDPMQRATRETKQRVDMGPFIEELFQFRTEKYGRHQIDVKVTIKDDFAINMNRGRLLQVLDNILRNSEYWLQQSKAENPSIRVSIASPVVTIWDNGPGIKPALEETLFEPFVTDKPRGYGSGLGLFIVSQLLKKEGCDIRLLSNRNGNDRRYRFAIDFSGAATD